MRERAEAVAKLVSEKTGRKTSTTVVLKNNIKMHGILIETEQKGVFATIYIDSMQKLMDEKLADEAINIFEKSKAPKFDMQKLGTREYVLEHVIPCVIGRSGNEDMLVKYANVQFLDLAYTFRVVIPEESASYLLTNEMIENMCSNVPDVFRYARENLIRDYKTKIVPMEDVIESLLLDTEETSRDVPDRACHMAVFTNNKKLYGANSFLRKDLLKKYANNIGENLYILPCSIHELLVVPEGLAEPEQLRAMVYEVNTNELDDEDILSYSVYKYDRVKDEISVAP